MKKRLGVILLCLLVGVVVNVGVAWLGALWSPLGQVNHSRNAWPRPVPSSWPQPTVPGTRRGIGVEENYFLAAPSDPGGGDSICVVKYESLLTGWPSFALIAESRVETRRSGVYDVDASGGRPDKLLLGVRVPTRTADWSTARFGREKVIPICPLWPGFIVNTLLYAVLCYVAAAFAPRTIRRVLRAKHGRCLMCGYDLKGLPAGSACPECGRS